MLGATYSPFLSKIFVSDEGKDKAFEALEARYAEVLKTLIHGEGDVPPIVRKASLGKETNAQGRGLPYVCLGCELPTQGALRQEVLEIATTPLAQLWVYEAYGYRLTPWAYHLEAGEANADVGPGGVIGILGKRLAGLTPDDVTAAKARKMQMWLTTYEPEYMPEDEAEMELKSLMMVMHPQAFGFLQRAVEEGTLAVGTMLVPPDLMPHMRALLGIAANRRWLMKDLNCEEIVLAGGNRIAFAKHVTWDGLREALTESLERA